MFYGGNKQGLKKDNMTDLYRLEGTTDVIPADTTPLPADDKSEQDELLSGDCFSEEELSSKEASSVRDSEVIGHSVYTNNNSGIYIEPFVSLQLLQQPLPKLQGSADSSLQAPSLNGTIRRLSVDSNQSIDYYYNLEEETNNPKGTMEVVVYDRYYTSTYMYDTNTQLSSDNIEVVHYT